MCYKRAIGVDPRDLGHVGAVSKSFPFRFRKLGMCVCHSVGFLAGTRAGNGAFFHNGGNRDFENEIQGTVLRWILTNF